MDYFWELLISVYSTPIAKGKKKNVLFTTFFAFWLVYNHQKHPEVKSRVALMKYILHLLIVFIFSGVYNKNMWTHGKTVNGKREGKWMRWYREGKESGFMTYKNGVPNGEFKLLSKTGKILLHAFSEKGKKPTIIKIMKEQKNNFPLLYLRAGVVFPVGCHNSE